HHVEVVQPRRLAQITEQRRVRAAGEFGNGGGKLGELEGRKIVDAAVEDQPRQHLVLRQFGLRGEHDLGIGYPSRYGHEDGDVGPFRGRHEMDHRVEVADQRHLALGEDDALADNGKTAADQLEAADRPYAGDRSGQLDAAAEFDVQSTATHED